MQKVPTRFIWTSGITNVPKHDRNSRYTFFELDTKDIDKLHFVLDVYRKNLGSCYVHELISGYHFYNFKQISKEEYARIIKLIKHLNPLCPLTVLRLLPNKWIGEQKYWKRSAIIGKEDRELAHFKQDLENESIGAIALRYETVRYPYEECPICKSSMSIDWNSDLEMFICSTCRIQTIGRVKPKIDPNLSLEEQRKVAEKMKRRYNETW